MTLGELYLREYAEAESCASASYCTSGVWDGYDIYDGGIPHEYRKCEYCRMSSFNDNRCTQCGAYYTTPRKSF